MSSSSFDTASSITSDPDQGFSETFDDISCDDPDIAEAKRLTKIQERESRRYQRELKHAEQNSKKWTKRQVETVTAIKEAEIEAKRYELERIRNEFQVELANKEAETDAEMREIEAECGELMAEIQQLEMVLSEEKDQRKRDLLAVRSQIAAALKDMEQKEVAHAAQISKLTNALAALKEKHKEELLAIQNDTDNEAHLIDIEIQRLTEAMNRCRQDTYKADDMQGHRMSEASSTIEMLKSEIAASYDRSKNLRSEADQQRGRLSKLQQELFKAEERSHVLSEQLQYQEEQKKIMKQEITKLDRSLWNSRKSTLLRHD